jgi:type IV pilus assembly protein PilB
MPGISQVQVGTKVSFASALRSFLRHDPDVIMVGEIRDGETANIAMKASLTGHMVFSTLHTNSAVSTISRLKDIGVEPFLIGTTLVCVIAQRLVRRLCTACKQAVELSKDDFRTLNIDTHIDTYIDRKIYQAKGCANCHDTGFKGRIALFETLWVDDELGELIASGVSDQVILKHAKDFTSLAQDCTDKILSGATSLSEFKRLSLSHGILAKEISTQMLDNSEKTLEVTR